MFLKKQKYHQQANILLEAVQTKNFDDFFLKNNGKDLFTNDKFQVFKIDPFLNARSLKKNPLIYFLFLKINLILKINP